MSEIILAPRGKKNDQPIAIDMDYWARIEARIQEVATVTPVRAPELLATFNMAALEADRLALSLDLEYQLAVREHERLRGEILLDRVPAILREKGLATSKSPMGSEDLREAVLSQDVEYQEALERADMIKAIAKMIRGKYDAFERAFRSVRTLVGEQSFSIHNRNLSGDTGSADVGKSNIPAGFGKPRY